MVIVFRRKQSTTADFCLELSGLRPDGIYKVDFFSGESRQLTGRELASLVIHLDAPRSFQVLSYAPSKQ